MLMCPQSTESARRPSSLSRAVTSSSMLGRFAGSICKHQEIKRSIGSLAAHSVARRYTSCKACVRRIVVLC